MEKTYAQALFNLSQKPGADSAALVAVLVANLKATGRAKLLPRILTELKRLDARNTTLAPMLEVATEAEKAHAVQEARTLGIDAEPTVNESLITGWRARTGSRIIDRSGKQALIDLYSRITTHA